jgi:acylphosphatase
MAAPRAIALRFRVLGRVQGVGFRWFAERAAERLQVSGWVANQADGSVVGEAAGDSAAVDDFLAALRVGPPGGRVDAVETAESGDQAPAPGFVIRRG